MGMTEWVLMGLWLGVSVSMTDIDDYMDFITKLPFVAGLWLLLTLVCFLWWFTDVIDSVPNNKGLIFRTECFRVLEDGNRAIDLYCEGKTDDR